MQEARANETEVIQKKFHFAAITITKKSSYLFLWIKKLLAKHLVTQVFSLDLKKTPVYFNFHFLINGQSLLTLKP